MPVTGKRFTAAICAPAALLLSLTLNAYGECREPVAPTLPKHELASIDAMERLQSDMQHYVKMTEDYLECLSPNQRNQQMDGILVKMKQVTGEYNALMVAYRKRKTDLLYLKSEK